MEVAEVAATHPLISPFLQLGIVGALAIILAGLVRYVFVTLYRGALADNAKLVADAAKDREACTAERERYKAEILLLLQAHEKKFTELKLEYEQKHRELAEKFAQGLESANTRARDQFGDIVERMSADQQRVASQSATTIDKLTERIVTARGGF